MPDPKNVLGIIFLAVGCGFCTSTYVQSRRVAGERANEHKIITDSISVATDSILRHAWRVARYNADVNQAIGGMRQVLDLHQDSISLPRIPIRHIPDDAQKIARVVLGEAVKFRWQTNDGDFVAITLSKRQIRTKPDRSITTPAVIFTTTLKSDSGAVDLDFDNLTQQELQWLIDRHVHEAKFNCPVREPTHPATSKDVC